MRNKKILLSLAFASLGILSACGSSGGATVAPLATLNGAAIKGPYQIGSTVVVNDLGAGGAQVAATTITDNLGNYSVSIPAGAVGPFEVIVQGNYIDEMTGAVSTTSQPTSMVIATAAAVAATPANMNPITSIQTELVKSALAAAAAAPAGTPTRTTAEIIAQSGTQALQALGVNTVDANGVAVDPAALNVLTLADPVIAAQMLTASATVAQLVSSGVVAGAPTFTLADLAKDMAADVQAGNPLGTTSTATAAAQTAAGVTTPVGVDAAAINSANTAAVNNSANLLTNLTAGIDAANAATAAAAGTAAPASTVVAAAAAINTQIAAIAANPPSLTSIHGYAISGGAFNVGAAAYTVASGGMATTVGATTAANVMMTFTLVDRNNATGVAAGAAITVPAIANFSINGNNRSIQGSIPVTVTTDGFGGVILTSTGTANYSGVDSAGLTVSGTAPAAGLVTTATAGTVAVDAAGLLALTMNNAGFAISLAPAIYTFNFSLTGINTILVGATGNTNLPSGINGSLTIQ